VGIIKGDVELRGQMKDALTANLGKRGYNVVCALDEYAQGGLAKLGEQSNKRNKG
jgi:hypothetical protein